MPLTLGKYHTHDVDDTRVVAITADGGCRLANPSKHGGMWAFRHLNRAHQAVREACGAVTVPEVSPLTTVTNNFTEVLAVLIALEFLPDGWSGKVRTDSLHTIRVFRDDYDRYWLIEGVKLRIVNVLDRLGDLSYELLAGHPSKKEIALMEAGIQCFKGPKQYPYCLHNHHLDSVLLPKAWSDHEAELERIGS